MRDASVFETPGRVESGPSVPSALVRRVWAAVAQALVVTVVAGAVVRSVASPGTALRWGAASTLALVVVLGVLVANRAENHPPATETVYSSLGLPNAITLGRGVLVAWVAGFVFLPAWPVGPLAWVPAVCYGAAAVADALDGAIARRNGRVTRLGERLDMEYDALGLLVAPLVGVVAGVIPAPYLAVGVARYAFVAGIALRERRGRPVSDLPERSSRRVLAGAQMAYVAVALVPATPSVVVVGGALVFGGGVLVGFARDWLYVSGRLRVR
jgi:CDP-diacylglycerol--glycerol-3-phosphate 3-phosphatidyltransferase